MTIIRRRSVKSVSETQKPQPGAQRKQAIRLRRSTQQLRLYHRLLKSENLIESGPQVQMWLDSSRPEPDECGQNITLGACGASTPKVAPVLTRVQRPVLFSVHPAQHLTNSGPAGPEIMPSLISLGHRAPHQHQEDGCRDKRCWNGPELEKCLVRVQGAHRHNADLEKDQLLVLSGEGQRTCVSFNLVVFVYQPTHYGNLILNRTRIVVNGESRRH